jgi:hypothetical protein
MSFTQDELQALNTLFDQKMAVLRRELDRSLDQRMQVLRRDFEQRQTAILQDLLRGLGRRLSDQQHRSRDALYQRLEMLHSRTTQTVNQEFEQRQQQQQQQIADIVDRALAAQLLAFEQLINQRLSIPMTDLPLSASGEDGPDFDAIEVQTEIPWDDLVELIDKALTERLQQMSSAIQMKLQDLERTLFALRDQLPRGPVTTFVGGQLSQSDGSNLATLREVLAGLDQLERLVESMQVAMTANSALLSNRLYYHQQLSAERAHPHSQNMPVASPEPDEASPPSDSTVLPFPIKREGE